MRFKLTLEYCGGAFAGWQLQPGQRTVQSEVERALEALLLHPTRVFASGRTDAGVHARGQVCHFDSSATRTPTEIERGLNAKLPPDVAAIAVEEVPGDWDARRLSWGKHYRYRWLDRHAPSPLRRARVCHVRRGLSVEAMAEAASSWVGTHDLSSFRASGCAASSTVRVIQALEVARVGDEVHLDARGHGFLRHTIRIMAGTLTEIGHGRRPASSAHEVLQARDRRAAGKTAPALGLELVEVLYGDGPPPWKS